MGSPRVVSLATGLIVLVLPVPFLQLLMSKKVGLIAVFLIGIL